MKLFTCVVWLGLISYALAYVPSCTLPMNSMSSCISTSRSTAFKFSQLNNKVASSTFSFPAPFLRSKQFSSTKVQASLFSDDENPKATRELMKVQCSTTDSAKLTSWLKKWHRGQMNDGYGLPKLLLPVKVNPRGSGLKIEFTGTPDPWLLVDVQGDTIVVYRQTMMSTHFAQVSALKEREEGRICEKLKADLASADFDAPEPPPSTEFLEL